MRSDAYITNKQKSIQYDRLTNLKPTTHNVSGVFGSILKQLRTSENLPLRRLEEMSGVPNPIISSIEKGRRCCGAAAANKLADAIYGVDETLEKLKFLYGAACTLKSRGIIDDNNPYPPAVLDIASAKLRSMKIRARDIISTDIIQDKDGKPGGGIDIKLQDGRKFRISVQISKQPT